MAVSVESLVTVYFTQLAENCSNVLLVLQCVVLLWSVRFASWTNRTVLDVVRVGEDSV